MSFYTSIREYFRNLYNLTKYKNNYKIEFPKNVDKTTPLEFQNFNSPTITIIIPFFNQCNYTIECLRSIYRNQPLISYEIILVNDNSSENVNLDFIKGVNIITNKENLGFTKSVNNAIQQARGEFIYLLNNDTIVHQGFLDELYYVFNNFQDVGAVGSMLLNRDGTLQEAGAFFLQTGHPTQVANKPIYSPEINYIYQVDYCSCCSLMFKRIDSKGDLNLLDQKYAPAYYEDADLCFKLRYIENKKIYYTPFSKVTHFNGFPYKNKAHIADKNKEKLLKTNHIIFSKKWNKQLEKIQSQTKWDRLQELYDDKNIIFFHYRIPQPDNNSGELRLTEIIKTYCRLGYNCALVAKYNKIKNVNNEKFQRLGVRVFYQYKPLFNYSYFLRRLKKQSQQLWFSTSDIFLKYHKMCEKHFRKSTLIFDMVDIHHLRYQRALEFEPNNKKYKRRYKKYLKKETLAANLANITITISNNEELYMKNMLNQSRLITISNIHYPKINLEDTPSFEQRENILFIGSSHHPNIDAIKFLKNEILPLVWNVIPEIKLNIIGDVYTHFKNNTDERINFLGYIPDITEQFLKNRIMVAPLRYGAGVKGKIGQAFEYFLPVVTSSIGSEGMYLDHEKNSLLADNAQDFAEQIINLYQNKKLWVDIQNNLEESIKPFSPENLVNKINEIASINKLSQ